SWVRSLGEQLREACLRAVSGISAVAIQGGDFRGVTGVSSVIAHRSEIRQSQIASNIGISGLATIKARSRISRTTAAKTGATSIIFGRTKTQGTNSTASNGTTTRATYIIF